jgi:hemolysin activation/secretion protein
VSLKGLVLVADQKSVHPEGRKDLAGVHVDDALQALPKSRLILILRPYLQRPLSETLLEEIKARIVSAYRDSRFPLVDPSLPPQEVTGGVVQLLVLEGRAGKIRVQGERWFKNSFLRGQIRQEPGKPLDAKRLLSDVSWLNANPFRQVDASLTPGEEFGSSDLVIKVRDRLPVRVYGGFENTGTDLTGNDRYFMGLNWGNAFGLDHLFSYQFTTSSDWTDVLAHSASYTIPLPWRHRFTLAGSYGESSASSGPLIQLSGKSWQVSARYGIPLPGTRSFEHEFQTGPDFKQSNNNLDAGGVQVLAQSTDVAQWSSTYSASLRDKLGRTSASATLVLSPGEVSTLNDQEHFEASRAMSDPSYTYARFTLGRVNRLPWDMSLIVNATWQVASDNLLASEQMGLGGNSTVRGFAERQVNGDEGWLVSTEIRSPEWSPLERLGWLPRQDHLQLLWFWDVASAYNRSLLPDEDPSQDLMSTGPGLRYAINPYLSVRFDYGWQLQDPGGIYSIDDSSKGHLSVTVSY